MIQSAVTFEQIKDYSDSYNGNVRNIALTNAVARSGINGVAFNNAALGKTRRNFSIELETGKATNQKQSGRCWLFAGLNVLRERISKKYNIEDFELSQNYQAFWDKFEKANYFLECMLDTLDEDIYSRLVMWFLQTILNDGGQWDMFCNIVDKYGVVPKEIMPETFQSSQSAEMNQILVMKLKEYAVTLRKLNVQGKAVEELRILKYDMLKEFYRILCIFLGEPPKKFDFEYCDRDKKYCLERDLDPRQFFLKYADIDLSQYISIINAPTKDKPFGKTYTVQYLGNVKDGKNILYLNKEISVLKELAVMQLKSGEPVWFGSDVGKMMDRDLGILDASLYRYDVALETTYDVSKAQRLDYCISVMTHAMVFTGVNLADGKPDRWKVENSWGEDKGRKGYFTMSDSWFDEYVYQVVVNKKYLSDEMLLELKNPPIELPPWDPMGSLA